MSNKLIKTVKKEATAKKFALFTKSTIFRKTIYGDWNTRLPAKDTTSGYILDTVYEIYAGIFYNYQQEVKPYEKVILLTTTFDLLHIPD